MVIDSTIEAPALGLSDDMKKTASQNDRRPPQLIDGRIKEVDDRRGEMLGQLRALIKEADCEVVEEWKRRGVPVWLPGLIYGIEGSLQRSPVL